jgi:hypothetical protein
MNIAAIKRLADRSPVERVSGVITKCYPPTEQNDNDRKNGRHRQNIYIKDETGEITVTLTQAEQHLLDAVEGKTLILAATVNEAGDARGLLWETWQKQDGTTAGCVKAYHQASVRIEGASVPAGAAPQQRAPQPQAQQPQLPLQRAATPDVAVSEDQFTRHLRECSIKYRRCFESARQIGGEFNLDMERTQGIATTLFIECKGREMLPPVAVPYADAVGRTHQPSSQSTTAEVANPPAPGRKWANKPNEWLYQKLANGSLQRSKLPKAAVEVLDEVWDEVEERAKVDEMTWADAYRVLCALIVNQYSKNDAHMADVSKIEAEWRGNIPSSKGNLFRLIFADAEKFLIDVENETASDNDIPM